jgi:hypothetical protein
MLGIPLEPRPHYPSDAPVLFLTADSALDEEIVAKIKQSLLKGSDVFITSGLYQKLSGKGIEDILPVEVTDRKVTTDTFTAALFGQNNSTFAKASGPVTMPHITYNVNDLWILSAGITPFYNHPLLIRGSYGNGRLYILTVPDAPADLYKLPAETLTLLRREMNLPVTLECGGRIGLFPYDNDTFIIQSFMDKPQNVRLSIKRTGAKLTPLEDSRQIGGRRTTAKPRTGENESVFEVLLMPGRYAVFKIE